MIPPIFPTVAASASVTALIGTNPVRFYPAGEAPQDVATPYCVWQVISGLPENYLGSRADVDEINIQIDCYADTYTQVIKVASATRVAIENKAYITSIRGGEREPETDLYRYSFDVAWFVER